MENIWDELRSSATTLRPPLHPPLPPPTMGSDHKLKVAQYLVDTRKLWPGATKTKQLEDEVGFPSFLFLPPFPLSLIPCTCPTPLSYTAAPITDDLIYCSSQRISSHRILYSGYLLIKCESGIPCPCTPPPGGAGQGAQILLRGGRQDVAGLAPAQTLGGRATRRRPMV